MERMYSSEAPKGVVYKGARRVLNYDIVELSEEEINALWEAESNKEDKSYDAFVNEHRYGYYTLNVGGGRWNYSGIVEAIIRDRYSVDEMEAINNNMAAVNAVYMQTLVKDGIVAAIAYLKESADSEDTEIFKAMQEWRALAKSEARKVFGMG